MIKTYKQLIDAISNNEHSPESNKSESAAKATKTTHYVSEKNLQLLDKLWISLRSKKRSIAKSQIIEAALAKMMCNGDILTDEDELLALCSDMSASNNQQDARLTVRIPKSMLDRIDELRKQKYGSISRNLWIIQAIEKQI